MCGKKVKVQIQKNTGYCSAKHQEIGELLARYHELQSLEGLTVDWETAIAREQGQVWRAYLKACKKAGVEPESSEKPRDYGTNATHCSHGAPSDTPCEQCDIPPEGGAQ